MITYYTVQSKAFFSLRNPDNQKKKEKKRKKKEKEEIEKRVCLGAKSKDRSILQNLCSVKLIFELTLRTCLSDN